MEDCRHVTGRLERDLLAAGERVVRVPPRLMAGARQAVRALGKSDPIDALGVHPSLAQHHPVDLVRFAFMLEPDQAVLLETLTSRSARFRALPAAHQHTVAQANRLYGQWLRQQAQRYRQPWVESRPWSTLPDRLVQAWQRPIPGERGAPASA